MLIVFAAALAAEPVVEILDDSWVHAELIVNAPIEKVAAVISDPAAIGRIDGTVAVTAAPDGDCLMVHTIVDHPIASVDYDSRVCAEGEGTWHAELVGDGMKSFESFWTVEAVDGGTKLGYRVRTLTRMRVPQWLVNRSSVKSVTHTFEALRDHLEAS